jgi:FkbM family methyltransferase
MKDTLILSYLRNFPIDYGKQYIEGMVNIPKGTFYYTNPMGLQFLIDPREHVMRQIYLKGLYEKNTLLKLIGLARKGDTFVDVGANVGAYSLPMSKYLGDGKVIAFEPNPRAIRFLEENIKLNRADNILLEKMGLSDVNEEATLFTPSLTTASINKHVGSEEQEKIRLTTLDEYCDTHGIKEIDLMKIDVEGHEYKCLHGARKIIAQSKRMVLVMEIDDNCLHAGITKDNLFQFIISMGFKAYLPKGYPRSMKHTDMIPANYTDNVIFIKG